MACLAFWRREDNGRRSELDIFAIVADYVCKIVPDNGRHCLLRLTRKHDDCRLRLKAHEAGVYDGSLHSTLTADVET